MSSGSSITREPVSILKRNPADSTRRAKASRVSVELNSKATTGSADKGEKTFFCGTGVPTSVGGHLQEENAQLVAQNHRLLSELENTSQQLFQASSKLGDREWGVSGDVNTGQGSRVKMLEAQVELMKERLAKTASAQWKLDSLASEQQREKEEFKTKQTLLEQQLIHAREECRRLRESQAQMDDRPGQLNSSSLLVKSSSSQSLPATYHQTPPTVALTTNTSSTRPHPPQSSSTYKSYARLSETLPLPVSGTSLNPSLSGSNTSLNSIKSTKSAQEFPRFSTKPPYQYGRTDAWARQTGLTSTPKSKPFTTSGSLYHTSFSSSNYPSFSSYPHSSKQPSLTGLTGAGSRPLKRSGSSSSYTSLTGKGKQRLSQTVKEDGSRGRDGGGEASGLTINITTDGHRSALSYLTVDERRKKESSISVRGGIEGSGAGSESLTHGSGRGNADSGGHRQERSPLSPNLELERARAKIRLLEKEVALLEQQLSDKAMSSQSHVEELTRMRSELAQERASISIFKQELQEGASKELSRSSALHAKQTTELTDQLDKVREEKRDLEKEVVKQRAELKARNAEVSSLSERVSSLHKQLDQERRAHEEAMQLLNSEVKGGSQHMTQLEQALRACQDELEGHVTRVEQSTQVHKREVEELQKHVEVLSSELEQTQHQLLNKTELATRLQRELSEMRGEFQHEAASWREREAELKQSLHQSDFLRQSLIQQVERSSQELNSLSGRLTDHQLMARDLKSCQSELDSLRRRKLELETEKEHVESIMATLKDEKQRVLVEVGQEKTRNTKLASQLKQMERQLSGEVRKREEGEASMGRLKDEASQLKREMEVCRERVVEAETRAREKESTVEDTLTHMQQELAKRAQQVLEMDGLLRNHQADTTARRLQLERTLAQRQSEVRSRTQEVDELTVKLSEVRKRVSELEQELGRTKMDRQTVDSGQRRLLQEKDAELTRLKDKLKEMESLGVANSREMGHLKTELGSISVKEREWQERCGQLERKVEQLTSENDSLREHHLSQVQKLQDTHSSLLASRELQANSHRQQIHQLAEQERVRQEELSRCRAQVASLSAELAAERRVCEEARQQLGVARTRAAKLETQAAALQRSGQSTPVSTPTGSDVLASPFSDGNHAPSASLSSTALPPHMLISSAPSLASPAPSHPPVNNHKTSSTIRPSSSVSSSKNGVIDL